MSGFRASVPFCRPIATFFTMSGVSCFGVIIAGFLLVAPRAAAQETPYFVAYSHHLEEPGNLEVEFYSNYGTQHRGNDFIAPWLELEYGITAWWTTEFYFDSQKTFNDSALYTGNRWENRFRPLMKEHWINPVLYVEFENINGANKTMKEVVGFDSAANHAVPNNVSRLEHDHEIETKLILSSDYKGWNISENFIAEKNLGHSPWEFGYAAGASRPLRLAATTRPCNFCAENFIGGIEFYGGLGTAKHLTLAGTSHYAAPILAWQVPNGVTLSVSPGFGLTEASHGFLLRFRVAYEISGFGRRINNQFRSIFR
jgi:hypothetical protein